MSVDGAQHSRMCPAVLSGISWCLSAMPKCTTHLYNLAQYRILPDQYFLFHIVIANQLWLFAERLMICKMRQRLTCWNMWMLSHCMQWFLNQGTTALCWSLFLVDVLKYLFKKRRCSVTSQYMFCLCYENAQPMYCLISKKSCCCVSQNINNTICIFPVWHIFVRSGRYWLKKFLRVNIQ